LVFLCLAILAAPAPVRATITYDFTATQRPGYPLPTFSLQYVDTDSDGKFSLNELVADSFSGFTYGINNYHYITLITVPPYNNTPTSPWYSPLTDGPGSFFTNWVFMDASEHQLDVNPYNWIESQTQVVPLPATVVLLGAGLLPLAWAHRKKLLG